MSTNQSSASSGRTVVAGSIFIVSVFLFSVSGASMVGSFLHKTAVRTWVAPSVALATLLSAVLRPVAPRSSIHRPVVVIAVSLCFVAVSVVGLFINRPSWFLSGRDLFVVALSAAVLVVASVYTWRQRRSREPT